MMRRRATTNNQHKTTKMHLQNDIVVAHGWTKGWGRNSRSVLLVTDEVMELTDSGISYERQGCGNNEEDDHQQHQHVQEQSHSGERDATVRTENRNLTICGCFSIGIGRRIHISRRGGRGRFTRHGKETNLKVLYFISDRPLALSLGLSIYVLKLLLPSAYCLLTTPNPHLVQRNNESDRPTDRPTVRGKQSN